MKKEKLSLDHDNSKCDSDQVSQSKNLIGHILVVRQCFLDVSFFENDYFGYLLASWSAGIKSRNRMMFFVYMLMGLCPLIVIPGL